MDSKRLYTLRNDTLLHATPRHVCLVAEFSIMALGYVPREDGDAMMRQAESQALAAFITRIRPDWDHPGIVAAIRKAANLGTPADIGTALCRLAANPELRTPALLSEPGPHWHGTTVASRVWPVMCEHHPDVRASRCDLDGPCAASVTTRGAGDVKAALRGAPRLTLPVQRPQPKPRDLDETRKRADQEARA